MSIMHPYLNTAIAAARSAGKIITNTIDRIDRIDFSIKTTHNDLVTSTDIAVEEIIISQIRKAYPDHSIIGEESGEIKNTNINDVIWIIDPIDGTLNFVHGFPYFCISIGIQVRGIIQHGVVYNPLNGELFTASKGSGAQLDGRRIRVSKCPALEQAIVSATFSYNNKHSGEDLTTCMKRIQSVVLKVADIRRGGSAALELANIAAGRLDAFWEVGLWCWDVAAGSLLVREAGGFVSDLDGNDKFMKNGKIIAGTPKIFHELLNILKN